MNTANNRYIHIIIGTKAQLIKMAPVMLELQKRKVHYRFIFTGQHQETIDALRQNFGIKEPDVILYQGKDITGLWQMAFWFIHILSKTITHKRHIFGEVGQQDIIVVHGDTFSTLLGALMGKFAGIKVAHVESGLRSFSLWHPFPEEITRLLVLRLSQIYFCPGAWAVNNLFHYRGEKIDTDFNTLIDALHLASLHLDQSPVVVPQEKYAICTLHRFENIFHKERLQWIVDTVVEISRQYKVLFILHLPTKRQLIKTRLLKKLEQASNIELRPRYDYFDFIVLLKKSEFVISDGGSNQEECYYLGKPCVLLRDKTERQEGMGQNIVLSRYDDKTIRNFVQNYASLAIPPISPQRSPSAIILEKLLDTDGHIPSPSGNSTT